MEGWQSKFATDEIIIGYIEDSLGGVKVTQIVKRPHKGTTVLAENVYDYIAHLKEIEREFRIESELRLRSLDYKARTEFNPTHADIERMTEDYIKAGGKITKLEPADRMVPLRANEYDKYTDTQYGYCFKDC